MKLITDPVLLDKAIASVKNRASKLDADVQLAGLSALHALETNGNVHYVNALYLALGRGQRKKALEGWLLAHGSLAVNVDKETKKDKPFSFDRKGSTDLAAADQSPWYTFAPEPEIGEYDIQRALANILKQAASKGVKAEHASLFEAVQRLSPLLDMK